MKLMKKLKIGGAEYKVIRGKETEEEYVGYHDYHRGIIKISKTHSGEVRNDRLILETVLHEVIHAVSSVWLDDRLTEKAVTKLSLALFAFFADNDLMLRSKEIPKQVKYMGFIYSTYTGFLLLKLLVVLQPGFFYKQIQNVLWLN